MPPWLSPYAHWASCQALFCDFFDNRWRAVSGSAAAAAWMSPAALPHKQKAALSGGCDRGCSKTNVLARQ